MTRPLSIRRHPAMLASLFALFMMAIPSYASQPNLLLITVDDMNADSIGAYGCKLEGTTPTIDRLAASGLCFDRAHVQVGNCMPCRNVLLSGRYPYNNRVEGFYQVKDIDYPVLADLMKEAGYFVAIRGKVNHSTPYTPYDWDLVLDMLPGGGRAHPKDPASYGTSTTQGIQAAQEANKPFCLVVNVSDPHKPFYTGNDPYKPSRVYQADGVPIPGFLFDDPMVRKELADYYSTVRRADDCVESILKALDESGKADETVVMFLSDHGMPLPFAKTQLYHHSTHTPWIVRWPGVTKAGSRDDRHMISAVDLVPTLLDLVEAKHPDGLDGHSFLPLIKGESQKDRDSVFKVYSENAGGHCHPMRAVQTPEYLYIFNPWSDGKRVFRTATQGTATYRRMKQLAGSRSEIAARLDLFDHRVLEEFYDVKNDPDCLHNLIESAEHQDALDRHRQLMDTYMANSRDPMRFLFKKRDDQEIRQVYINRLQRESIIRRNR